MDIYNPSTQTWTANSLSSAVGSVAAATALRAARLGYKTLAMSTDAAHSLGDSFDRPLGGEIVPIVDNLWGQEIDVFRETETHWGTLENYIKILMAWRGIDEVLAEEMAILPGMEELAGLVHLINYHQQAEYDVIVVDCAPTGETLRLLSFPDVTRWWLHRIFPIQRTAARTIGSRAETPASRRYWKPTAVAMADDAGSRKSGSRARPKPPSAFWNVASALRNSAAGAFSK